MNQKKTKHHNLGASSKGFATDSESMDIKAPRAIAVQRMNSTR